MATSLAFFFTGNRGRQFTKNGEPLRGALRELVRVQQRRTERVHQHRLLHEHQRWRLQRAAASRGLPADLLLRGAALYDPVHLRQETETRRVVAAKGGKAARQQLPRQVLQATRERRLLAEGQAGRILAESEPGALRGESGSR